MTAPLTMHEVAAAAGLHYDTFRKRWAAMVVELGFPRPLHGRRWSAEAVDAWKARRSAAEPQAASQPVASDRAAQRRRAAALEQLQRLRAA